MSRGTLATVHLGNIAHNLAVARDHSPGKRIWAVVKANAYGHGLAPVARHLAPLADGLAVATLDEALSLRDAALDGPILLLEGVVSADQTRQALSAGLELVVHTPDQVAWLAETKINEPIRVWMKLDTGMHRLGFSVSQVAAMYDQLCVLPGVREVAFMSHYACADEPQNSATENQAALFQAMLPAAGKTARATTSLANSAGILLWPERQGDWVRPGIMLYGASPMATAAASTWDLRAGMTLTAPVIAVRTLPPGESIGYGGTYRTTSTLRLATVAMGYADGYPRHAPSGTPAWLRGQRVTMAGRVSMDMLTLDVTALPDIRVGDPVELWGPHIPVDEVAHHCGTVGYELLARLSIRGRFAYDNGDAH